MSYIWSEQMDKCDYCDRENVRVFDPILMRNCFELVLSAYRKDNGGRPILELLMDDWALFPQLPPDRATALLTEVLDDQAIGVDTYIPRDSFSSNKIEAWEELKVELKHRNRFFPASRMDHDRLRNLLDFLILQDSHPSRTWFRARLQAGTAAYSESEMGAPPEDTASHGRANPAGIPYLYLASEPETALSEIRPHVGDLATVANVALRKRLKIVDLRHPRKTVSPLSVTDESEVAQLRVDIGFLEKLGEELSRPVLPNVAAIDYIPTQYLCELIKTFHFDGVMYASSVGEGDNLALFEPEAAVSEINNPKTYQVIRVSVDASPVSSL
ncbi:RES domain-containing protein [bacterium]|nr:RES domain-containing protein [bacterium]